MDVTAVIGTISTEAEGILEHVARGGPEQEATYPRYRVISYSAFTLLLENYPFVIRVCLHCSMTLKLAGALREQPLRTSAIIRNGHTTNMSPLSIPGSLNKQ